MYATPPEWDLAAYQYLPPYKAPRSPDGQLRNFKSFELRKPSPPLNSAIHQLLKRLDDITSTTILALSDLRGLPDLRAVDRLHLFPGLRADSTTSSTVQEFRTACQRVVAHIALVTERWDHTVADLFAYLPLRPLERLEQLLSGISPSHDHYPTQRNKVLSLLPSLRAPAQHHAAVLKALYEELANDILFIEAERRAADLPHTNLNIALAALIWQEWGLAQYCEDMHFARLWDSTGGPSDFDTTDLINGLQKGET
ncbi:hypothetical protein FB45DRAFT_1050242 [Roridomyces roridus]|uniref:Uncharacterized protein n=1 Tax=Roridomyces roridus TaxID=1738132 RepID=A0AAD7CIP2_9AGAR|nr:hypothetical protein FB45DRAFT_1050242 [Roridomyces roridus]